MPDIPTSDSSNAIEDTWLIPLFDPDTSVPIADSVESQSVGDIKAHVQPADGTITTAKLADNSVTQAKIASGAVDTTELADGAVSNAKLGANAVGTNEIQNASITQAKLAAGVGGTPGTGSIGTAQLADASVTHVKLANDAVDGDNIADNSITDDHIANNTIDGSKIEDGTLDGRKIIDGSITGGQLATGGITHGSLGTGIVELDNLASDVTNQITAQHSLLARWNGHVDPLSDSPVWLSNASGKYDASNDLWPVIGSAANPPSNDRNNQLYQDNAQIEWDSAFAFNWRMDFTHVANASNGTGSLQVFWGGNAWTSAPAWLGSITQGLGLWTARQRTQTGVLAADYDQWLFVALRVQNSGAAGNPSVISNGFLTNDATYTTLHNGALRPEATNRRIGGGTFNVNTIGFYIPETDAELNMRVQGINNLIYLFVNGKLYATLDLTGITGLTYGPRYGWLGDNNGDNGNQALIYEAYVGTPDPTNASPQPIDGELIRDATVEETALDFSIDDKIDAKIDAQEDITSGYWITTVNDTKPGTTAWESGGAAFVASPANVPNSEGANRYLWWAFRVDHVYSIKLGNTERFDTFVQEGTVTIYANEYHIYRSNVALGANILHGDWTFQGSRLRDGEITTDLLHDNAVIYGAETIQNQSALPSITGYNLGDKIDVGGTLYTLLANTEDIHIYQGTVEASPGGLTGYFGDENFSWQNVDPHNMRGLFSKVALGSSPPSFLWIKFHAGTAYDDIKLARASGHDTPTQYGYVHAPGTPGLENNMVGVDFTLTVFSNDAYTTPQQVQTSTRWEKYNNVSPVSLQGNHDRWDKDKLPEDTAYTDTSANSRGALQATSSTLPTSGITNGQPIPGVTWTLEANTNITQVTADATRIREPKLRSNENQTGWWFVAEINGVETFETYETLNDSSTTTIQFDPNSNVKLNIAEQNTNTWQLRGNSSTLPANSVIKVYSAINSPGITGTIDTDQIADEAVTYDKLGSPRGSLIATSSTLPTASVASGTLISGVTWTTVSPWSSTGVSILIPRLASGRRGLWLVAEVGATEVSDVFLPSGWYFTTNLPGLWLSTTQEIAVEIQMVNSATTARLHLYGASTTIPANTVVKIYEG